MAKVKIYDGSNWVELLKSSDISAWAKASSKPAYTASEVGAASSAIYPNDSGEIKTKNRISLKGYTGNGNPIWYYKLLRLPVDNSGNYASAIVNGRIGGWVSENMSSIYCLIWNRNGIGLALLDIGGTGTMSSIFGTTDLVVYKNSDNTADVYLKCKGYFTFDLDVELFQSTASFLYDGSYVTTEPTGTLGGSASTSSSRLQLEQGTLKVNGTAVSLSGHTHSYLPLGGGSMSGGITTTLANGTSGEFKAVRGNYSLFFGIGSGNVNRGIYDDTNASWLIYRDDTTNVYIGGAIYENGTALSAKYQAKGSYAAASHSHNNATTSAAGFMSATDKTRLDSMWNIWEADGSGDTLVNKVTEVVSAFDQFSEGNTIVGLLANKVSTTRTVNGHALTSDISITASDVGALPTGTTLDNVADGSTRKLANYLPLSGGTITASGSSDNALNLKSATSNSYLKFSNSSGTVLGYLGVNSSKKPVFYDTAAHQLAYTSDIPTTLPASDVSAWAKAATKPSYTHNEIGAGNLTIGDGANTLFFRTNASWASAIYHNTTSDEAVVFLNKGKEVGGAANYSTSWIFAYGNPSDRPTWTSLTPAMQIKGNSVVINKLLGSKVGASYNLDVNGTLNATTIYQNGTALATVATSGSYNDLSNKPTIPSVSNATITIKQTGLSDQTFTLNGSATTITLADNNTTYSNGTGLTLSNNQFSVSKANASTILNLLDTGSSTPVDADYYISQYVGGGTSTTSYHRRPMSALWSYVKGKADSVYQAKGSYLSSVSINGTSGSSFTLNGSNLNVSSSDQTKISAAISALQTAAAGLSSSYAIDVTETDSNNANCYNKIFNDDVTGNIIEALNDYFVAHVTIGGNIASGTHGASYASNSAALAYIKTAGGTNVLLSSLKVGDTIFLRQTNLPDVWVTEVSGVGTSALTIGFSVLEPFKLVWGAIHDIPESFTPSSHSHGNITNSGTITSTAVTSATGVLVYDSNNKIQRATAANARTIIGAGTGNGTVTSVRVQAGTGLSSSTSTAQSSSLDTTISIASGYKLPTTTEWNGKQNSLTTQTAYSAKGSATKVPQITTNTLGQVTSISEVTITNTKTYKHDIAITDSSNSYIINFTAYSNTSTALTITGAIQLLFNKPPAVASGNRLSAWAKSSVPLSIVKVEWTQSYFYPRAILADVTYSGNNLTSFTIRPMEGAMDFDGYNMRISLFTSDIAFTVSKLSISDTVTEC